MKPETKRRLEAAAERRITSQSRIAELAIVNALDRLDAEDGPVVARRARMRLMEEV